MDVISVILVINEHFIWFITHPHTHIVIYMYISLRLSQILYFLCLFQSKGCSLLLCQKWMPFALMMNSYCLSWRQKVKNNEILSVGLQRRPHSNPTGQGLGISYRCPLSSPLLPGHFLYKSCFSHFQSLIGTFHIGTQRKKEILSDQEVNYYWKNKSY